MKSSKKRLRRKLRAKRSQSYREWENNRLSCDVIHLIIRLSFYIIFEWTCSSPRKRLSAKYKKWYQQLSFSFTSTTVRKILLSLINLRPLISALLFKTSAKQQVVPTSACSIQMELNILKTTSNTLRTNLFFMQQEDRTSILQHVLGNMKWGKSQDKGDMVMFFWPHIVRPGKILQSKS